MSNEPVSDALNIPLSPSHPELTPLVLISSVDAFRDQVLTLGVHKRHPSEDTKLVARCMATRERIGELADQLCAHDVSVHDYWQRPVAIGPHIMPFATAQRDIITLMAASVFEGTKYGFVRSGERGRDNLEAYLASTLCLMKLHVRAANNG